MAKKKSSAPVANPFGLGPGPFNMECTQAAQTARAVGKRKKMLTEGSYQFKAKVHAEDLLGTPFFNDVFVVIDEATGKQMNIEGGEKLVGGTYEPRATDFAPYSHVKDSDHNVVAVSDRYGDDDAARTEEEIECRSIKLKKVIAEGEYATLVLQLTGCNPHAVGWREWVGQTHGLSFSRKADDQIHREAMEAQNVKVIEGQGDLTGQLEGEQEQETEAEVEA